ncbi:MAG: hypothetical protein ONB44_23920 [candidate division KSB1 bacterium]|nr:hypothetical protein [candidate division KSB1 bacterium]MDZ7305189.1 hypothetical protein [candidate division KSB1 bacterium]MDZ7314283.1 hypothetical protein [candidate division KSB1 bacterium]
MKDEILVVPNLEEHAEKAEELYERKLKKKLEPKYKGKMIAIEVESGKYFMGDDLAEARRKAEAVFPDKIFYFKRVGYKAAFKKTW